MWGKLGFFLAFMIMELFKVQSKPELQAMKYSHLDHMAATLDVNSRMVDWQELDLLQVSEAPEQNLQPVLHQLGPDGGRDGKNGPEVRDFVLHVGQVRDLLELGPELEHLEGGQEFTLLKDKFREWTIVLCETQIFNVHQFIEEK